MGAVNDEWNARMWEQWKVNVRRRHRLRPGKARAVIAEQEERLRVYRAILHEERAERAEWERGRWSGEGGAEGAERADELLGHARPLDELRVPGAGVLEEGIEARCPCGRVVRIGARQSVDDAEQVAHLLE